VWFRGVLIVAAVAGVASANPAAEKVFQDGKTLLAQGKTAEACDAFRRSQELEPRVGTLLNLAECEEQRGRIATAWVAFVDARALATRMNDPRAPFADKRAAALVPRLPYLTTTLAGAERPSGLVVRRNGAAVLEAELGIEVPLDPGHYDFEVSAPGFAMWKHSVDLTIGQRATIVVPALTADGTAVTAAPVQALEIQSAPPRISSHRIGVGAAIGVSSDSDLIYGLRIPLHLAPVGTGTIRAVPSLFYAHIVDGADVYHISDLFAVGFAVEYVAPLASQFVIAAGLGVGLDLIDDSYSDPLLKNGWGAARLSPTLRLGRSIDIGLHLQVVATKDAIVGLGELGVDYFFW